MTDYYVKGGHSGTVDDRARHTDTDCRALRQANVIRGPYDADAPRVADLDDCRFCTGDAEHPGQPANPLWKQALDADPEDHAK